MNFKKAIINIVMIHLLCQCSFNNRHYERAATEFCSFDIDPSLINIIKLYIEKNPKIGSVALYFNNETDINIEEADGTYFTIGEFVPFAERNKAKTNIPFEYFCVEGKRVYIVSEVNILFSKEYIKWQYGEAFRHRPSNATKDKEWLIKCEEDWSTWNDAKKYYKIIRK